jgi:NAD(P)-dependent dehydrogenase (short-subunit alcohol dehydrogenase family)
MMRLPNPEDGVALITGASSGIGRALAIRLAAAGWTVIACAPPAPELEETAAADTARRIHAWPLDVTDPAAVNSAVAEVEARLGAIALGVLNAGAYRPVSAGSFDPADFRALIELNLMGVVNCLAALLPVMRPRKMGQIAITASVAGYRGSPTASAYGMTKAGLINMAESLAPELAREGICLQIVNPGFVATPLTAPIPFPMPFIMSSEAAAQAYYRGLLGGRFEIAFPWRLVWRLKIYRCLPYFLTIATHAGRSRRRRPTSSES